MINPKIKAFVLNVVIPIAIVSITIFSCSYINSLQPHRQIEDYELEYYKDMAQVKQLFYDNKELFDAAASALYSNDNFLENGVWGDESIQATVHKNIYLLTKDQQKTLVGFYQKIRPVYIDFGGTTVEVCLRGTFDDKSADESYVLKYCLTDESYKVALEYFEFTKRYVDIEKLDDKWIVAKSVH